MQCSQSVERVGFIATMLIGLAPAASCAPPAELDPDAGPPEDAVFPILTDPEEGAQDVLIDKVLRLTYPIHIDSTTLSQSQLRLRSGPLGYWLRFYYDPVRAELVVWPSRSLRTEVTWVLSLGESILDLDGNILGYGEVLSFATGTEAGDNAPYVIRSFATDVLPIFQKHCASCHAADEGDGFANLYLNAAEEIASTAVGEPSNGWPGRPRIAAYMPGNSYLLYKIMGDPRIAGVGMPRTPDLEQAATPIPCEEQHILVDWIASGALFFDSEDTSP